MQIYVLWTQGRAYWLTHVAVPLLLGFLLENPRGRNMMLLFVDMIETSLIRLFDLFVFLVQGL